MPSLTEVQLNGKTYEVGHFTGIVVDERKWSETEVSGSGGGGGGYLHKGTGYSNTSPVSISSKTTRHDQFILQNPSGREKSFKFTDLNLACRQGNTLSVVWLAKKGAKQGLYRWVYNHQSEEHFPTADYAALFEPPLWRKALAVILGLAAAFVLGMPWYLYIGMPLAAAFLHRYAYYRVQRNTHANNFWETAECRRITDLLRAEAPKAGREQVKQVGSQVQNA